VPLTFLFARRIYGSADIAAAAAAALAVNPYFAVVGQLNLLDSGLCFFLTGAVFAFLTARDAPPGSPAERRWMMLAALSMALAVLSKGPVALVLAGATALIHLLVTRSVRPLRRWHLGVTIPLFSRRLRAMVRRSEPEKPGVSGVFSSFTSTSRDT